MPSRVSEAPAVPVPEAWKSSLSHSAAQSAVVPICRGTTVQSFVGELSDDVAKTVMHMTVGRPCEVKYGVYRPFAGVLPADTVTGAAAVKRLEDHELPPDDSRAAQ